MTSKFWIAALIVCVIGLLKEIYDVFIQKDNSLKEAFYDILADLIGILSAALYLLYLYIIL